MGKNKDFEGVIDWNDRTNAGIMADDEESVDLDNEDDLDDVDEALKQFHGG